VVVQDDIFRRAWSHGNDHKAADSFFGRSEIDIRITCSEASKTLESLFYWPFVIRDPICRNQLPSYRRCKTAADSGKTSNKAKTKLLFLRLDGVAPILLAPCQGFSVCGSLNQEHRLFSTLSYPKVLQDRPSRLVWQTKERKPVFAVQGLDGVVPFSVAVPGPFGAWKFKSRARRLLLMLSYPKDALELIPRLCVVTKRAKTCFCSAVFRQCRSVLDRHAMALCSCRIFPRTRSSLGTFSA
jgi:hypothetical protein